MSISVQKITFAKYFMVHLKYNMGLDAPKPVFGVSDKAWLKSVSSCKKTDIPPVTNLDMMLTKKWTKKAQTSLCICADWSAPLLFSNPRRLLGFCVQKRHRPGCASGQSDQPLAICLLESIISRLATSRISIWVSLCQKSWRQVLLYQGPYNILTDFKNATLTCH